MNTKTVVDEETIEGIDTDEDSSLGDYPIDTLLIRNESRTVHDVIRRIEKGSYIMDPDFQRDFIWTEDRQCKLIESVIMRIPLPVFYLAENREGKMIVVDGLQRLSTFRRFVNNELKLKLPHQSELHNKYFRDLSPKLQNRIEDCNLILYLIDSKVPSKALLDIFERVNGGVPLTRQQMRNSLFSGPATKFLAQEVKEEIFKQVTGNGLNPKTMRDREMINRFCAFYLLGREKYRGDMDEFLAFVLEDMNTYPPEKLISVSEVFRRSMHNNYVVYGRHAFRKHTAESVNRSVFNASLWDVMSTGLADYSEELVVEKKDLLRNATHKLLERTEFKESISLSTNQVNRVEVRFSLATEMFREVFGG